MATKSTKFPPGTSGNPKGRPKGIQDRRVALRRLLEPHAEALVSRVVERALEGDTAALRICMERLVPPLKAADQPCKIGALTGTLGDQARAVVAAIGSGYVTPDQGTGILDALVRQAKVIETDELERRLAALEDRLGPGA